MTILECCNKIYFWQYFIWCILLLFVINDSNCEWFSSVGQMEDLVHYEIDLSISLSDYIQAEEGRLTKLKKFMNKFQNLPKTSSSNMDQYLGHPVNQYRLVKRLATEWLNVQAIVLKNDSKNLLANMNSKLIHFPDKNDLKGSAQAIMRLQATYKLDTHELAQGVVKGLQANQSLTSEDCYFIGRTAYLDKDYPNCVAWMKEVLNKDEKTFETFSKFDVLDHISYCVAQLGRIEEAKAITERLLIIEPKNKRLLDNIIIYKNSINWIDKEMYTSPEVYMAQLSCG